MPPNHAAAAGTRWRWPQHPRSWLPVLRRNLRTGRIFRARLNVFMRMKFAASICIVCCFVASCSNRTTRMGNSSETSAADAGKDVAIFFCWFVEDDGRGRSGYALFGTHFGRPLLPDERLCSTIDETRLKIKSQGGKAPIIVPQSPDWVPEGWRVRNLNTNEMECLGLSDSTIRPQP